MCVYTFEYHQGKGITHCCKSKCVNAVSYSGLALTIVIIFGSLSSESVEQFAEDSNDNNLLEKPGCVPELRRKNHS